jgi:hypothetical protein
MSLTILACLPLAACDVFIVGGPSATPTAVPTATPSGPSGGSGSRGSQSGVALISYTPKGSITLNWIQSTHVLNTDLTLQGMTPNSRAELGVYTGDCNAYRSPAVYQLKAISADANGKSVNQTSQVSDVANGISATWVIIVSLPNTPVPGSTAVIACGTVDQLSSDREDQQMTIQFGPFHVWNANVSGSARLDRDADGVLTVSVSVDNLQPNTTQGTAIQNGNCTYLSYTIYDLPALHADNNGHATSTITISRAQSIPDKDWYVAVFANDATVGNNNRIVGCGEVQLQVS